MQLQISAGRLSDNDSHPRPSVDQLGENDVKTTQKIAPCLWFDDQAEAAAAFYTSIFRNSKIVTISRYGEAGRDVHRKPAGTVMTVAFELDGQAFTALNGGPNFKFNEAISFQVNCETQEEVDHFWDRLSAGGDEKAKQCKGHRAFPRLALANSRPEDYPSPSSATSRAHPGCRAVDTRTTIKTMNPTGGASTMREPCCARRPLRLCLRTARPRL